MLDEINLKILIIGDSSSGKTQLLLRYVDEFFPNAFCNNRSWIQMQKNKVK